MQQRMQLFMHILAAGKNIFAILGKKLVPATRIQSLTGIRAIAAIMVFLYHNRKFWRDWLPDPMMRLLNEFHTGVSIFFVLSGFLIAYTYQDKPMIARTAYLRYVLVRLARIFPVYLIILTASYCHHGFPSPSNTLLNYTLLKGLSDVHNLDGIPQSWSLTVELCFYTVAPLLYIIARRKFSNVILFCVLLLALSLAVGYGWYTCNGNTGKWLYPWFFVLNTTFFGRFAEFVAGMWLAQRLQYNRLPANITRFRHHTAMGCSTLLLCIAAISFFEPDIYGHGTDHIAGLLLRNLLLPVTVVQLIYGLTQEATPLQWLLGSRLLVLLGNASYLFYLLHIGYANNTLAAWTILPDRNFVLLWIISILGYWLVEKPAYQGLKRLIQKIR